jgi:hypothetical protein
VTAAKESRDKGFTTADRPTVMKPVPVGVIKDEALSVAFGPPTARITVGVLAEPRRCRRDCAYIGWGGSAQQPPTGPNYNGGPGRNRAEPASLSHLGCGSRQSISAGWLI